MQNLMAMDSQENPAERGGEGPRTDRQIDLIDKMPVNLPPDLSVVVSRWHSLPQHIKDAIAALVGTVKS